MCPLEFGDIRFRNGCWFHYRILRWRGATPSLSLQGAGPNIARSRSRIQKELRRAQEQKQSGLEAYQLNTLIDWYIKTFQKIANWQRTKQTTLQFLERHEIGHKDARHLTSADLIEHVQKRREQGAGPATVGNDLTWIGVVLRAAKGVTRLPLCPEIVQEARAACRELRLISKSRRRERRPSTEEIQRLDDYFGRGDRRSKIPLRDIWHFAMECEARSRDLPAGVGGQRFAGTDWTFGDGWLVALVVVLLSLSKNATDIGRTISRYGGKTLIEEAPKQAVDALKGFPDLMAWALGAG